MSKENELLEDDLTRYRRELDEEKRNKRKLDKVLRDAAQSLKTALHVSHILFVALTTCLLIYSIHIYVSFDYEFNVTFL